MAEQKNFIGTFDNYADYLYCKSNIEAKGYATASKTRTMDACVNRFSNRTIKIKTYTLWRLD